jgi:hypothetical protein
LTQYQGSNRHSATSDEVAVAAAAADNDNGSNSNCGGTDNNQLKAVAEELAAATATM